MECPHIRQIGYARFGERLNRRITERRIPINGALDLTFRFNLNCAHCYCNLPSNHQGAVDRELGRDDIFRILDQIAEAGCLWLLISGGEPFLRKDFSTIYTRAKSMGFLVSLFTNGTLITPVLADFLAEWPPFSVEITLYGASARTYEKMTRTPGSFERCLRGIELLREREVPLELKTMVTTMNRHETAQIIKYADELGVKFRYDPILNPRLDGSKRPCDYRLSPEEVLALDYSDEKRVKGWQDFFSSFSRSTFSDHLFICGAGVSSFHIDPYGMLSPCEMVRFGGYDLSHGTFKEGWSRSIPELLQLKPEEEYRCGQCELIPLCGQCPGWSWLENGKPDTPVDYLCRIAHLREEAFCP